LENQPIEIAEKTTGFDSVILRPAAITLPSAGFVSALLSGAAVFVADVGMVSVSAAVRDTAVRDSKSNRWRLLA
jgi:hypothetical protein